MEFTKKQKTIFSAILAVWAVLSPHLLKWYLALDTKTMVTFNASVWVVIVIYAHLTID
jgi:hypothetical protein